jgi:hypothetical protein
MSLLLKPNCIFIDFAPIVGGLVDGAKFGVPGSSNPWIRA